MHPIPYLGFNGNCAEAMRFYASVLDGTLEVLMSGADAPPAAQVPKEFADRILHARLALKDGGYLYGGDAPGHLPFQGIHGAAVSLHFNTIAAAQKVFDKLAAGGKVTMAFAPSFWAKGFGMLVDRFGIPWIVNGELLI
jgi:PhnB protein